MKEIIVRKALASDLDTLKAIGKQTFLETFSGSNTEADMQQYLTTNFSTAKVSGELGETNSLFYIAWEDEEPIGYLKVNTGSAQTEVRDDQSLEIERIYVLSSFHGKRVGQLLYEKALEIAISQNKALVWLGVWEENLRAIRFYEKNGFTPFDKHIFKLGQDDQTDIMMRKVLI